MKRAILYFVAFWAIVFFVGFVPAETWASDVPTPGVDSHGVEWGVRTVCQNGICRQIVVPISQAGAAKPLPQVAGQTAEPEIFVRHPVRSLVCEAVCRARGVALHVRGAVRGVIFRRCE